jgi:Fe-S oxidoreductase
MLDTAKTLLQQTIAALRKPIRDGVPVIGLEPSCMSVFRDELPNLMFGDEDATRLHHQSFLLSEFLKDKVENYQPPQLRRRALVHGHCHQKALLHFESEVELLKRAGIECHVPGSGCCGMAGSFGYEADHYKVGLDCGERVLLPAVRNAAKDDLIVTDGFSCREMIGQETDRKALHFAQVLQMAIKDGPGGPARPSPENPYATLAPTAHVPVSIMAGGALLAGAGLAWALRSRHTTGHD